MFACECTLRTRFRRWLMTRGFVSTPTTWNNGSRNWMKLKSVKCESTDFLMTAIILSLTISSFYLATCTRLFQKLVHDLRIDFFLPSDCHFPRLHTTEQSSCLGSPNFTNLPNCLMARKYLPLPIPPLKDARRKSALTNGILILATKESVRNTEGRFHLVDLLFKRHKKSHAPSSMWPSSHTHVIQDGSDCLFNSNWISNIYKFMLQFYLKYIMSIAGTNTTPRRAWVFA